MLETVTGRADSALLGALNWEFETRCAHDAQSLLSLDEALAGAGAQELRKTLTAIGHLSHQMRGTAPSFGEPDLGMTAGALEDAVSRVLALGDDALAGSSLKRIRSLLHKLYLALGGIWLRSHGHTHHG